MVMHRKALRLVVLTVLFFGLAFVPLGRAHHSFAKFDQTKVEHVRGTVKDFEWINPHTWLHLDLVEANGAVRTWAFEGGAPEQLASLGWKPEEFHAGENVEIGFRPMKDGSRGGQLLSAKMANGAH